MTFPRDDLSQMSCYHSQDAVEDLQTLTLQEVISGLRPLVVWMSNSLELLQVIQLQLPLIVEWRLGKEQRERDNSEVENLGNNPECNTHT